MQCIFKNVPQTEQNKANKIQEMIDFEFRAPIYNTKAHTSSVVDMLFSETEQTFIFLASPTRVRTLCYL